MRAAMRAAKGAAVALMVMLGSMGCDAETGPVIEGDDAEVLDAAPLDRAVVGDAAPGDAGDIEGDQGPDAGLDAALMLDPDLGTTLQTAPVGRRVRQPAPIPRLYPSLQEIKRQSVTVWTWCTRACRVTGTASYAGSRRVARTKARPAPQTLPLPARRTLEGGEMGALTFSVRNRSNASRLRVRVTATDTAGHRRTRRTTYVRAAPNQWCRTGANRAAISCRKLGR